jgi:hypothetical protein
MSEASNESVSTELAQRVAQLEAEATVLEAAWLRSRNIGRGMLLFVLVLVTAVLWKSYDTVSQIEDKQWQDKMYAALVDSYSKNQLLYQNELTATWKRVEPDLIANFKTQLQADSPRIEAAFITERDKFQSNIRIRFKEALLAHYEKALDRNEDMLKKEFPTLQDEARRARVIARTREAIDELIDKYYIGPLEDEFGTLYASYEEFPIADPPDEKTDEKDLTTRFVGQVLELLKLKLISAPDDEDLAVP